MISNLKNLNFESLRYLVSNSGNGTSPITITLHPDAYARLTEELIATAADKNITLASA